MMKFVKKELFIYSKKHECADWASAPESYTHENIVQLWTRLHAHLWLNFFFFFVFDSGWNRPWIGPFKKKKHWNALEEEELKRMRKIRTRWEQKAETHLKSEATTFPRYRGSRETKKRKRKIRIEGMTDWVCDKEWVGGKEWMWFSGWVVHVGGFGNWEKWTSRSFLVANYSKCWFYLQKYH